MAGKRYKMTLYTCCNALLFSALLMMQQSAMAVTLPPPSTNYKTQELSVHYNNTGLPTFGTLNGTVTDLDTISPRIMLNKTDAALNCSSGFMNIRLTFKQAFFGIVYADDDRNSACKVNGNGKLSETIQLPLKGCGTLQKPTRVFTNNIFVRFHPGLEIDGDEVITVVCRYPPPIVPEPIIPGPLVVPPVETINTLQPLREFEILLIICAIIFLALLLLGIGCSYYCLKKRNIKVVRRRPTSTLGSDITKISEPASMFGGLKIPRPHAVEMGGSDELTESIRTDFASETGSAESEEDYTSAYSDKLCILSEGALVSRLQDPPLPNFDIHMIIKDHKNALTTPDLSLVSSDSETVLNAQEQYLTTILERTETNTKETLERVRRREQKNAYGPPPVHARINIKKKELSDLSGTDEGESISEYSRDGTELFSEQELELETRQMSNFALREEDHTSVVRQRQQCQQGGDSRGFDVHIKSSRGEDFSQTVDDGESISTLATATDFVIDGEASTAFAATTDSTAEWIQPLILERNHGVRGEGVGKGVAMAVTSTAVESRELQKYDYFSDNLNNFDVLIRIVNEPSVLIPASTATFSTTETVSHGHGQGQDGLKFYPEEEASTIFTEEERNVIKKVLLEDQHIQDELKKTFVREDFIILRDSEILEKHIEPQKWDVLIKVVNRGESESEIGQGRRSSQASSSIPRSSSFLDGIHGLNTRSRNVNLAATAASSTTFHDDIQSAADRSGTEITEYHHYRRSDQRGYDWMEHS